MTSDAESGNISETGPWSVHVYKGDVLVASDDFTHDVTLNVSGDFGTQEDKKRYAQKIADILNAGTPFTPQTSQGQTRRCIRIWVRR